MKIKNIITAGLMLVGFNGLALAQTEINLTGATAFRAASHNAILNLIEDVEYAYVGNQALSGANRAIFKGTIDGIGEVIVRTSWSGSGDGIKTLVDGTTVQLLDVSTPTSAEPAGPVASPVFVQGPASFAFSDVAQIATETPSPALNGQPVGVVPFAFVASRSAPEHFDNVTDQMINAIYSTGQAPLSLFTGESSDATTMVLPTGRASSSGTRITILAETGYGINRNTQQVQVAGALGTLITFGDLSSFPDGKAGYSSNSFIRDIVQRDTDNDAFIIFSYLTVSDYLAATAPRNGDTGGARPIRYNGVEYSEENVKNGAYTLWGYQMFYEAPSLTPAEESFRDDLVAIIPTTLGSAGIPIPEMNVIRNDGDGGPVLP